MEKVPVNKIIPSSLVDGPGHRTSIFLQGCNLACDYCHNPEPIRMCMKARFYGMMKSVYCVILA